MTRAIAVAVTSIRGGDAPSAGLVAAQMLRRQERLDVHVVALAADAFADGVQSLHVADRVVVVPPLATDPAGFVAAARTLRRETGRLVLVPGSAADTLALARQQAALERAGVRALLPSGPQAERLPFPWREPSMEVPRHLVLTNGDRPLALRRRWRFPVMARWTDGTAALAATPGDLGAMLYGPGAGLPVGVHETVPGTELSVALVAGHSGPACFVAARVLSASRSGAVWSAVTVADRPLLSQLGSTLRALRWRGPGEARFVVDGRGRLWFTGLIPAFPSWVSLAAAAGRDLVLDYVRLALGARPFHSQGVQDGLLLSRVSVDRTVSIDALHRLAVQGEIHHAEIGQ